MQALDRAGEFIMGLFDLFKPNVEKMEAQKDIDGLIKKLEYSDTEKDQVAAAAALGRIGDKRAVEPLILCLENDDYSFHKTAAEALLKLGWKPRNDTEKVRFLIALGDWKKVVELREVAIEPLISTLKKKKYSDRLDAAKALGEIGYACRFAGGEIAVDPLINLLQDQDQGIRDVAAYWLGKIGNKKAIKPLIHLMQSRDYISMRHTAARSLKNMGDTSAIELMNAIEKEAEDEGKALFQKTWGR